MLEDQAKSRVPELVPIRYGRMLVSPFTFYRGAAAIMAMDLAETPQSGLRVQACGDAHLSNFGIFAAPDRSLVLDVNDFDETLPGPWEWDVKRLAASFEVAGRSRDFTPKQTRAAVLRGVRAYREAMREFAAMGNTPTRTSSTTARSPTRPNPAASRSKPTWSDRAGRASDAAPRVVTRKNWRSASRTRPGSARPRLGAQRRGGGGSGALPAAWPASNGPVDATREPNVLPANPDKRALRDGPPPATNPHKGRKPPRPRGQRRHQDVGLNRALDEGQPPGITRLSPSRRLRSRSRLGRAMSPPIGSPEWWAEIRVLDPVPPPGTREWFAWLDG